MVGYKPIHDLLIQESTRRAVVCVIGAMLTHREEDFAHNGYLGNGGRTHGTARPRTCLAGRGPFHSLVRKDAIGMRSMSCGWDRLPSSGHWDIVTALIKCEVYNNGLGYAHTGFAHPVCLGAASNMQQERQILTLTGHFNRFVVGCSAGGRCDISGKLKQVPWRWT